MQQTSNSANKSSTLAASVTPASPDVVVASHDGVDALPRTSGSAQDDPKAPPSPLLPPHLHLCLGNSQEGDVAQVRSPPLLLPIAATVTSLSSA
jgi:hypothetical protein